MRTLILAILLITPASHADASCRIQTGKCLSMPQSAYTAPYQIGDHLPRDSFKVLLNVTYHGLPPSDGTFWYVRSGRHVYKVVPGTFEVLGDVTRKARRLAP